MTDAVTLVESMSAEQRKGAVAILDCLTEPLSPREIDRRLKGRGLTRSQIYTITKAIKGWRIVAMLEPEK